MVGIDDHPIADPCDLTTVRQPAERQGTEAARLALSLLGGGAVPAPYATLQTHLVRTTTAPVDPDP